MAGINERPCDPDLAAYIGIKGSRGAAGVQLI